MSGSDLSKLTPQDCIRLWLELMDVCDQLLQAGLRKSVGDEGDLPEAYGRWYERQRVEHDKMIRRMAQRLQQARGNAP